MSGTYGDPKGSKWHTPGKVDHSAASSKEVLVDGNNNSTKIEIETLKNVDAGEASRGVGQVNISAAQSIQKTHTAPTKELSNPIPNVKDERLAKNDAKDLNPRTTLPPEGDERQYPEGNKPNLAQS